MNTKETIVQAMQRAGYDTVTACKYAHDIIAEFMESGKQQCRYTCGNQLITIARR